MGTHRPTSGANIEKIGVFRYDKMLISFKSLEDGTMETIFLILFVFGVVVGFVGGILYWTKGGGDV